MNINENDIPDGLLNVMQGIENYLRKSKFDYPLLELIRYRISQINKCKYCKDMHYQKALEIGESENRLCIIADWKDSSLFSPREKAALKYAESLSLIEAKTPSHKDSIELKRHFSKEQICILTLAIAQINSWNRLMIGLSIH
ncbi:carboxymuconolactone decarboxylase family protein [Flavobacteriales bacterium]|nr:carboxymuconolactone decarboxylase family protein [Flavobacteriales bacterium]